MASIFETDDYREVLRRHLAAMGRMGSGGPTSRLARQVGITPGHLRNILTGRRKLLPEHLEGFVGGLGLRGEAADYFRALVRACHAPTAAERDAATQIVTELRRKHGFPRSRAPARPPGRGRRELEAHDAVQARLLALLTRPWVDLGLPAAPGALAAQLDELSQEPTIARALKVLPELSRSLRTNEPLPELRNHDEVGAAALCAALQGQRSRVHGLTPPDRSMNTSHALICAEDLPALANALDEAWLDAAEQARALHRRAVSATLDEPACLHLLSATLCPQTPPFHTGVSGENICLSVQKSETSLPGDAAPTVLPSGTSMPSPFDYLDLVTYLGAWLTAQRQRTPRYTIPVFARLARCTPSHVYHVFHGLRRLTDELLPGFATALRLQGPEVPYLGLLASLSGDTSVGNRAQLLRQMSAMHVQRRAPMPEGLAFSTLMEPPNLVVYEAASAPGFRADPAWIAGALGLPEPEAAAALAALHRAGLLQPSDGGGLHRAELDYALSTEISGPPVELSQLQFLDRATSALRTPGPDRHGRALGLALRIVDRAMLRQVAAGAYRKLHDVLGTLNRRALTGSGPFVVISLQVIAAPVSRVLRARPS